jgi:hypothetical protein
MGIIYFQKSTVKAKPGEKVPGKKSDAVPREHVPQTKFELRKLKWSPWKLAYSPEKPEDRNSWLKMYNMKNCYRKREIFRSSDNLKVYEISVQTHPRGKMHIMYHKVTSADLNGRSWERCLFQGSTRRYYIHKRQVERVLTQGCRVFIRKADVKKRQLKQVEKLNKYSYAWARSISGKRRPERLVIKNKKTLSGSNV